MLQPSLNDWMLSPHPTDTDNPDAQVASLAGYFAAHVATDENGTTLSVWTRSVPSALPKTDNVVLLDDDDLTEADRLACRVKHDPIVVPWGLLAAHLGARLVQHGSRYYVEPRDFPDEATRQLLGKPLRRRIRQDDLREVLYRLRRRISADPAVGQKLRELGEVPLMMMADPSEEFNWRCLEDVPLRLEIHDRIIVVLIGRVGERIAYSAQSWALLLPTN